ncbi:aggregation-promoting factor [Lactobacillus delbrueckii]|uniref:aggregation-promoting factor n=1 Tax=Lactobacillus delbrueckii TaxID=1584 RepID=UPI001E50E927|nr:aggregation promoting factor [Lactobacillus delbrueckii]MCD5541755.1 aggregation promoting factor [Lactobacillus delbrueckii subsp. lactis]MCD5572895.1 aggregation promoting factor [Lactobacillus delbrueckii subsp. lactis]MCD5580762.1 aggregation promoting factor [Lactobacillus delbrueckii subsp. lactis]
MNIKSNVLKSVFAAGLALTGVAAIGLGTNGQADAATIGDSVTVDYIDGQSIATWSNYYTATVTGSVKDGSSWKVVKTARDASGEKWYKIGKRQWIMAKYTTEASTASNSTYNANTTSTNTANSTTSSTGTGYTTSYSSSANNYGYGSNYNYSYSANTGAANTSSYSASTTSSSTSSSTSTSTASASTSSSTSTSTASASTSSSTSTSSSSSEEAAKAWIASKESGGSYTASNGNYYGKYQLSLSYLNGDTSAANQERVANSYVQSRYGSWTAAKAFWQANGWY